MLCVTPSHPKPIPPGELPNVEQVLERTGTGQHIMGAWLPDGRARRGGSTEVGATCWVYTARLLAISRKSDVRAQATNSFAEVKYLAQQESRIKFVGGVGSGSGGRSHTRGRRGRGVAPPECDEQESEWADVLQGEMKRLGMK